MPYDLLLTGGEVIDPGCGFRGRADVAIRDGRIAAVGPELAFKGTSERIDVSGCWVTPGLIDTHTHLYAGATSWGIDPDRHCLRSGVTTVVDAGSASWTMLSGFRWYIAEKAAARVLCFLHISGIGLVNAWVGEMRDTSHADVEAVGLLAAENRDLVVGIKVRQGIDQVGAHGTEPVRLARRAAELAGLPMMVHIGAGVPLPSVLAVMRSGDTATHCFQGRGDTILDAGGRLLPEVREARERGVIMDVGHGSGSFRWSVAEAALDQGWLPDVISTDLHAYNIHGPAFDMATTLSKFLHLGLSPEQVIAAATTAPARAIGRPDLGTLAVGAEADVAVLRPQEGEFTFWDTHLEPRRASRRLVPELAIRAGRVMRPADLTPDTPEEIERRCRPRRLPGSPEPFNSPQRFVVPNADLE